MEKSEEYAAVTFAVYNKELVIADTHANDKEYVDAATFAAYNEENHTDKNIVKGHTNVKSNKINEEDVFKQCALQWRLLMREQGEVRQQLLCCIDALGYKINTSSVTDRMTELGKPAVDVPFAVEKIVIIMENMIPEEQLIEQPDTRSNQPYNGLSKQTLPRFKDPALKQMLAQEDPALAQTLAQEDPALTRMLTQEDTALTHKLTQEDPALEQMLARGNQLPPTKSQLPKNEEEVQDSTSDLQMTNTSTEPFRERGAPTLQGERHDHH